MDSALLGKTLPRCFLDFEPGNIIKLNRETYLFLIGRAKMAKSNEQNYGFHKKVATKEYRIRERREKDCRGFIYVSIVGWICRRENVRRENDNFFFSKNC
jgi:hypothetical protein